MAKLETTGVERPERGGKRASEVVRDDADAGVRVEPCSQQLEHRLGEIERDRLDAGPRQCDERQQPSVAAPQIQHALAPGRQALQQLGLASRAMRNGIGARQIVERVRRRAPQVDVGLGHEPILRAGPTDVHSFVVLVR